MNAIAGYCEIEHTADWELLVWGPNLASLLEQAARGMYALSQMNLGTGPRVRREFEISFADGESLIVDFLSELLYFAEEENLAFDGFHIQAEETACKFRVSGAPILEQAKEIKAVTFHQLKVRETETGLAVNIVFDV
jgi:SHS2 domain-containing protein